MLWVVRSVAAQEPAGASMREWSGIIPAEIQPSEDQWSVSLSETFYFVPQEKDYFSPLLSADHGAWHLEARYNYENLDAESLWLGYNFSFGKKVVLDFTPMVGGVFGRTRGIAPGWRLALGAGDFEFTSEVEFVFDARNSEDNFFYAWSELAWSPVPWFRTGLALQRTRAFETNLEVQRGLLVGFSVKDVDFTAYVFNLGWERPTFVFSVALNF
jgi:hypothetical protein